ncbi:hypothetical protein J2Z35_001188 [Acetoanaerobium pronyense]|uniref:DUF2634 domain-containing protein n=1 Tax=Acetoanaerobium pronyense TaxID=1482736 RepID=A0ABS4KLA7_9FIRM|nr:DUF2634 domain-containing protein [Acetoanaerobium pronyense]MBP2027394.1 hypothetical protein [Acetoanaerobium pronyense]
MDIFPVSDINLILQEQTEEAAPSVGKVYKFDFENGRYLLQDGKLIKTTKIEAIQQFVKWTLKTLIRKYKIYDEDYGMDYSFIGYKNIPIGFVNSELKRQIEEQLEAYPLINKVINYSGIREGSKLIISFTLITTENESIVFNESVVIAA